MLVNRADSHLSGARFVGRLYERKTCRLKKDTTANLTKFYTQLWFWPEPKKTVVYQNACYKSELCKTKPQTNQNDNFGKPDFAKKRHSQWSQDNFTNSTYQKLYRKKTSQFWEPTITTKNQAEEMKQSRSDINQKTSRLTTSQRLLPRFAE